ncbi:hypothetical protein GCM10009818_11370 [Nakamurella flavida]
MARRSRRRHRDFLGVRARWHASASRALGREIRGLRHPVDVRALRKRVRATRRALRPVDPWSAARSPAGWVAPPGVLPGWNWQPPGHGLVTHLQGMPWWARVWRMTPFVDRYARAWMWRHGHLGIIPTLAWPDEPGGSAGDRAPRLPLPPDPRHRARAVPWPPFEG